MKRTALILLTACAGWAQTATAPPAFEVASVKVAEAPQGQMVGGGGMVFRTAGGCRKPSPGLVNCTGATMKQLLIQAYDVKAYQIQGPAWIESERYDLMAKIPEGVSADQVPAMLQALLADRFKVALHKETRSLPAYELTVAKGGIKMKEVDQAEVDAANAAAAERAARGPGALPPPPPPGGGPGRGGPGRGGPMPIGSISMSMSSTGARTVRGKMTVAQLCNMLVNQLARPIFDSTNLKGTYEIELTYLSDDTDGAAGQFRQLAVSTGGGGGAAVGGSGGGGGDAAGAHQEANTPTATLTQAFQQSLGLKLEPKKAPVDMIVIDGGNKVPTEN